MSTSNNQEGFAWKVPPTDTEDDGPWEVFTRHLTTQPSNNSKLSNNSKSSDNYDQKFPVLPSACKQSASTTTLTTTTTTASTTKNKKGSSGSRCKQLALASTTTLTTTTTTASTTKNKKGSSGSRCKQLSLVSASALTTTTTTTTTTASATTTASTTKKKRSSDDITKNEKRSNFNYGRVSSTTDRKPPLQYTGKDPDEDDDEEDDDDDDNSMPGLCERDLYDSDNDDDDDDEDYDDDYDDDEEDDADNDYDNSMPGLCERDLYDSDNDDDDDDDGEGILIFQNDLLLSTSVPNVSTSVAAATNASTVDDDDKDVIYEDISPGSETYEDIRDQHDPQEQAKNGWTRDVVYNRSHLQKREEETEYEHVRFSRVKTDADLSTHGSTRFDIDRHLAGAYLISAHPMVHFWKGPRPGYIRHDALDKDMKHGILGAGRLIKTVSASHTGSSAMIASWAFPSVNVVHSVQHLYKNQQEALIASDGWVALCFIPTNVEGDNRYKQYRNFPRHCAWARALHPVYSLKLTLKFLLPTLWYSISRMEYHIN